MNFSSDSDGGVRKRPLSTFFLGGGSLSCLSSPPVNESPLFIFYCFVVYEVYEVMCILFSLSVINLILTLILRHVSFC